MTTSSHNPAKTVGEKISLEDRRLAEAIRTACIGAALAGYEDASLSGLCHEGAWECAVDAMRALNLEAVIRQVNSDSAG